MHDSYQIMSQNDVDRQGGMNEAFITVRFAPVPLGMHSDRAQRSMLSRLASTLRERQGPGGGATPPPFGGAIGEGGTIVLDENCLVGSLFLTVLLH